MVYDRRVTNINENAMNKMKHGDKHDIEDDEDVDDDEEDDDEEDDDDEDDDDNDEQVNTTSCKPDDFLPLARERYHPHKALNPVKYKLVKSYENTNQQIRIPLKINKFTNTTHKKVSTWSSTKYQISATN